MKLAIPGEPLAHRFGGDPDHLACGQPWAEGITEAPRNRPLCLGCWPEETRHSLRETNRRLRDELRLSVAERLA